MANVGFDCNYDADVQARLETVNKDVLFVHDHYRFVFSNGEGYHVDPRYLEARGENYVGREIDSMYDRDVELCRDSLTGILYGVKRDYAHGTNGVYPVVIWQRMVEAQPDE